MPDTIIPAVAAAPKKACLIVFSEGKKISFVDESGGNYSAPVDLTAGALPGKIGRLSITFRVPPGKVWTVASQQLDWVPGCVPDRLYRLGKPGLAELDQYPAYTPVNGANPEPCCELTVSFGTDGIMGTTHPLGLDEKCDLNVLARPVGLAKFRVIVALIAPDAVTEGHVIFDGGGTLKTASVPTPIKF